MAKSNSNGRAIAIVAMIFLFGMISFVTNLAAPIGNVWKSRPGIEGSNMLAMMGNMMNFLAYFFMGIPSGNLLTKVGYKKTALIAIAFGFFGVLIQFLSGQVLTDTLWGGLPANWFVYLLGAFVAGISMCMLNTVVNPMLNLLGGGGNRGNQLVQIGGTFNSLMATITPMLVGGLIGQITKDTAITDVNPVLYLAMGIFAVVFVILSLVSIIEPVKKDEHVVYEHSPLVFRHFAFGVLAIFIYMAFEVGIPSTVNNYISDNGPAGAGLTAANTAAIGGFMYGTFFFLMLVGRFLSTFVASKISSRQMMIGVSGLAIVLIVAALFIPKTQLGSMPVFTGSGFEMVQVPLSCILLVICGICASVMWGCIFNLATEGLGKYTAKASGIFMTMVVGGGIFPLIQNFVADKAGYMISFIVPLCAVVFLFCYSAFLSKNVNKDIPV